MSDSLLILHPDDPTALPDAAALIERLAALGLIGDRFDFRGERHWRPGSRFLDHITFLGCSPVIPTDEPAANGEFCHISLDGPYDHPRFVAGSNVKAPRCPHCGYRLVDWRDVVAEWRRDPAGHCWRCPMCGREYSAPKLAWRRSAGFGRLFLNVWGVFESEAVPGDALTDAMMVAETAGRYFYLRR